MACSSWRALQGACSPTENREEPRCGVEKPLGHRQSPEGKGKDKGGGGAVTPVTQLTALTVPVQLSAI